MSATLSKRRSNNSGPSPRYLELIRDFPLRPITSRSQLQAATEILDRLFGRTHVDPGESDYMRVLAGLVEDYETRQEASQPEASGLDVLRHLMSEHDLKQAELSQILGVGPSAVSMILSGSRPITADHARKLATRFGVDAGMFI